MSGDADRFVDHHDVVVVVKHEQSRHRLGVDGNWSPRGGELDVQHHSRAYTVALEGRNAVEQHSAGSDQIDRLGTREPEQPGKGGIDTFALQAFGDGETAMFRHLVRLAPGTRPGAIETDSSE